MIYIDTLKGWFKSIFWQPHRVIFVSIVFLLLFIPVISGGIAISASLFLGRYCMEQRKRPLCSVFKEDMKGLYLKATVMWLFDILFIFMAISSIRVINADTGIMKKIMNTFYLIFDIFIIISGAYRWTILIYNKELSLLYVYLKAFAIILKYMLSAILLLLAMLTFFGICLLTGIGAVFIFPGAFAVFECFLYKKTLIAEGIISETYD